MKWSFVKKSARYILPLACLAFFFGASFGALHIGMNMSDHGHRHGCPFMGMTTICEMSPLEHIAAWQSTYATIILQDTVTAIIYALILWFAWTVFFRGKPFFIPTSVSVRRIDQIPSSLFSRALKEALMRGIVHPKVY